MPEFVAFCHIVALGLMRCDIITGRICLIIPVQRSADIMLGSYSALSMTLKPQ